MNPIVITGIMVMAMTASAMMISLSDDQVRYSGVVQKTSDLQAQRLSEEISGTASDGRIQLKNTGSIPVEIREIRVLDDDGRIIGQKKVDQTIHAAQTIMLDGEPIEAAGEQGSSQ